MQLEPVPNPYRQVGKYHLYRYYVSAYYWEGAIV